jgi:hypothetical protein
MPIPKDSVSITDLMLAKIIREVSPSMEELRLIQKFGEQCYADGQADMRQVLENR